ncbi:hypothetical protein M9458_036551 [Cirrhinus mrigala]|uniref:Uncharacterized protein n=1 Tax=Cirrhinus mrigala TaxID=683832 RepID=A0ABD0P2K8_CIRMR
MTEAEDALWCLRQGGRMLERYVEEFLKLANQLSWHDTALGACFHLGLDRETICCDLPVCDYPLIEQINLILYLNGSNFEVEEMKEDKSLSRCPAPSGIRRVVSAHSSPRTPTYRTNGSDCLPNPKYPGNILNTAVVLSPEPPAVAHSRTPPAARPSLPADAPCSSPSADVPRSTPPTDVPCSSPLASRVASHMYINIMDLALPLEYDAPILSPLSPSSPLVPSSPPASPLVPSSPPSSPLVLSSPPEPAPPEQRPEPAPLEHPPEPAPPERPPEPEAKATEAVQPWPPELPAPPWLPDLPAPPWPHYLSLIRHGSPNCLLHHGSLSSLIHHGFPNSLLRHVSPSRAELEPIFEAPAGL